MNPAESQLLIVDPSGTRHNRLHVQFKELGFGHVSSHNDLEESRRDCAQFAGPTLVLLFLGSSGGQLTNYARFYQRSVPKAVEVAVLADARVGEGVRRELLKLGVAEVAFGTDDAEALALAQLVANDPRRFLGPVDPRASNDNLFQFTPPKGARPGDTQAGRAPSRASYESTAGPNQAVANAPSRGTYESTARPRDLPAGGQSPRQRPTTPSAPSFESESLTPPPSAPQGPPSVPVFTGLDTSEPPSAIMRRGSSGGPSKGLVMAIAMGAFGLVAGLVGALLSRGGSPTAGPPAAETSTPAPLMTPIGSGASSGGSSGGSTFDPFANIPSNPAPTSPPTPRERIVVPTSNIATIGEIRQSKASWLRKTATIEGVVTMGDGGFVPFRNQFHLQDETGGILLDDDKNRGGGSPATGQRVRVTGQVDEFKGMLQLKVSERIVVLGSGQVAPRVTTPFEFNEALEGLLVRLENVTITQGRIPPNVLHTNMKVGTLDGSQVSVYLDPDVKIFGFTPPPRFSLQGILYQWAPPETPNNYQWVIYPRSPGDFVF